MSSPDEGKTGPVIRDLRRIDPATGQVRDPGKTGAAPPGAPSRGADKPGRPGKHAASKPGGTPGGGQPRAPGTQHGPDSGQQPEPREGQTMGETAPEPGLPGKAQELADRLAERTADLQRLSAEYANYRKRVERDRLAVREQALANVLSSLLPVLDDIGRAREHSELAGGFKSVAESLEAIVAKLGLSSFGEDGEAFDPRVHEAVAHSFSAEVTEPSVTILQPGYKVGERILRPAMVAVAEPEEPSGPGAAGEPPVRGGGLAGASGDAGSPGNAEGTQARQAGRPGADSQTDAAGEAGAVEGDSRPADESAPAGNPPGAAGSRDSRGEDN